ncbi:MAG: DUF6265 family protein [Agriterribacter sp.]
MQKLFGFIFLLSLFYPCPDMIAQSKSSSFNWLTGEWQMKRGDRKLTEHWEHTNDTLLNGRSYMVDSKGAQKLLESVELKYMEHSWYYVPIVQDQNNRQPIQFRIMLAEKNKFVAENLQHDFPKRITYELVTADSLHAWIDDGKPQPQKKSDFYYSRIKN